MPAGSHANLTLRAGDARSSPLAEPYNIVTKQLSPAFLRLSNIEDSVSPSDVAPSVDPDRTVNRVASVAVLIGIIAAIIAAAAIWLLLTDPVTVANAVDEGEISPLVRQLADVIYQAIAGLLQYL